MNTVRELINDDVEHLRALHQKYFAKEFTFEDFCQASISNFAVLDENNKIISAGAIRPIAEIVAITDYSQSARKRRSALYDMLQIAQYVLRTSRFSQLHAFVQDEKWLNQLTSHGFKRCVGIPVYINVE